MDGRVHPGWVEPLFSLLGWRVGGLEWSRGWNIPRRCGFTPSLRNWRTERTQFSPSRAPCPPSSPRGPSLSRAQARRLHREAVRAATPRVRRGRWCHLRREGETPRGSPRRHAASPPRTPPPSSASHASPTANPDKLRGRSVRASVDETRCRRREGHK